MLTVFDVGDQLVDLAAQALDFALELFLGLGVGLALWVSGSGKWTSLSFKKPLQIL